VPRSGVANRITARGAAGPVELALSNGSTDVLFDVLTLAGSTYARTPWEQHLVLHFADGHRVSRGCAGFDLDDLPWSDDWPQERAFLERMIAAARSGLGWDRLGYRPPLVGDQLTVLAAMVSGFSPLQPAGQGEWGAPPDDDEIALCPRHAVYAGELGCRLCSS
jgi:hypothetical protein